MMILNHPDFMRDFANDHIQHLMIEAENERLANAAAPSTVRTHKRHFSVLDWASQLFKRKRGRRVTARRV